MLQNKTLLITGGTGSFGNAVLDKFISSDLKEIRVFSRDEKKQDDMRNRLKLEQVKFLIGDVRDERALSQACRGVDYVFHAAALKQVPSCEFYPLEAIQTNILGTSNVLTAASSAGAEKVIVLSTDKAVYPINAMGMSKALAEKVMIADSGKQLPGETVFCGTRYGNVMASRGSVIPLFVEQIKKNEPITITDPAMTRFLMSLDESVDLVVHAFEQAQQGDIFVQKSPSTTIENLALALKQIFSKSSSEIRIIGTRHGEKLYETLVAREEKVRSIENERYFRIQADVRDLNYSDYFNTGDEIISTAEEYNSHNAHILSVSETIDSLMALKFIQRELNA